MPTMAEVGILTATNDSQNISSSLHEDVQDCDTRDSCKLSSENNNDIGHEPDGNLGDETVTQENSEGIKSSRNGPLPTQDGKDTTQMEQPREIMALEPHQTKDSTDIASSLGNEDVENQECINTPPNSSNLTQTGHPGGTSCDKQITAPAAALPNTITIAKQGNRQGAGSSLPVIASLASTPSRGTCRVSPYFTRAASKAHPTSSVPQQTLTVPSTSLSSLMSGSPITGSVTTSSNPFTTFDLSLCQNSEPVPIISASTANNVSQTTVNNSTSSSSIGVPMSKMMVLPTIPSPLPNLVVKQDDPVSANSIPGHTTIPAPLPNLVIKQDDPVSANSIPGHTTIPAPLPNLVIKQDDPVSANSIPGHTTIPVPSPNLVVKQDDPVSARFIPGHTTCTIPPLPNFAVNKDNPVSTSSIPSHTLALIPQSVTQTLVTLPIAVSAASTTTANSNNSLVVIPSLLHTTDDPQSTLVSTMSSPLSLPSTNSSTMFPMIPAVLKCSDPEVPVVASNDGKASENNTQASANSRIENTASGSLSTADTVPDILSIFSDFTPCSKCNSILVCSCPGPSSIGGSNSVVPTTCQAACQGVCTCDGMKVDQADGKNPLQDVKPQIFPEVPLNLLDQLFDGLVEYDKVAKAEQPEAITTRLFPYQLQALNWMITRENNTDLAPFWKQVNKRTWFNKGTNMSTDRKPNSAKGGILADDMGLGKTLVVITLIMANHLNGQPMFAKKSSSNKRGASTSSQDGECKPEPAEKMPRKEGYDGDDDGDVVMENKDAVKTVTIKKRKEVADKKKRLADSKTLKQPGFKFRQMYLSKISSKSIKKEKCKEKKEVPQPKSSPSPIMIDIDDNSDVLVGPWLSAGNHDSIGTKGSKKALSDDEHGATLIVCPLSVLSNWTDQICSHVHPDVSLQVYMYYGAERLRDVNFLRQQDIVLTTYPTLTNDYGRNDSPLHKIKWLRIILDEGHTIRNPQTRLTKAMIDLVAKRRWVLTGTPIQNRLDDLWSVVKFLRLEPFDDKGWWKSSLSSSVRRGDQEGVNRLQKLLKHISIRRLKTDEDEGKPLVKLPPRTVVIQEVELPEEERKLYDAMQKHGQLIIRRYLQDGIVLAKYAHCFAILMRLRQLCLHPKLCAKECESLQHAQNLLQGLDDSDDEDLDVDHDTQRLIKDLIMTLSSGSDEECSVCLDSLVEPVITRCAHVFCQQCIMDVMTSESLAPRCPLCRAPLNENELIKVPEKKKQTPEAQKPSEESAGQNKKSAKLDALISALCAIRDKDPSTKSLVVSQFTSFLDLIEVELKKEDFPFVRLDGRMTQEARAHAIESFSDPSSSSPRVFLLSLTAGGVGLNLTAASRVFLMDPAWNPAIEEQCFDRSHRLGQTQEVIITKYIVMNSVEERMLSLQEQKRTLMGQAFGLQTQSQEDRRRARVRDIKHLIGL